MSALVQGSLGALSLSLRQLIIHSTCLLRIFSLVTKIFGCVPQAQELQTHSL